MPALSKITPPPRDKELRSRVRLFGNLLGEVLAAQAGQAVLGAVETLRKGYIRLRKEDNPVLRARLAKKIDQLDPDTLSHVVRAFNLYFSLVNIAEEAFQHKERRRHVRQGGPMKFVSTNRPSRMKSVTACSISASACSMPYHASIVTSTSRYNGFTAGKPIYTFPACCSSVPGSAATATAILSSNHLPPNTRYAST